jgi:hypothetical protein
MTKTTLTLKRIAKKSGGDRYEGSLPNEKDPFVIYLPQSVSRVGGVTIQKFELTLKEN